MPCVTLRARVENNGWCRLFLFHVFFFSCGERARYRQWFQQGCHWYFCWTINHCIREFKMPHPHHVPNELSFLRLEDNQLKFDYDVILTMKWALMVCICLTELYFKQLVMDYGCAAIFMLLKCLKGKRL